MGILVGKDANICMALDFPIEPLKRIDGMDLRPVILREGHEGEHVGFRSSIALHQDAAVRGTKLLLCALTSRHARRRNEWIVNM
jgi:hypothetical protein